MTTTLLHLINRAERGVLLPEEAQQLRDGIKALDAARRSAVHLAAVQLGLEAPQTGQEEG